MVKHYDQVSVAVILPLSRSLLCTVNSGNAAAKIQRVVVLTAMELAAYLGYAATRKVQIPWKTKKNLSTNISRSFYSVSRKEKLRTQY